MDAESLIYARPLLRILTSTETNDESESSGASELSGEVAVQNLLLQRTRKLTITLKGQYAHGGGGAGANLAWASDVRERAHSNCSFSDPFSCSSSIGLRLKPNENYFRRTRSSPRKDSSPLLVLPT